LIGAIGLTMQRGTQQAELGYWVGRRHWGQGLAFEAARRLLDWAFANLALDRVEANVLTDNDRSAALLQRLGMRETGRARRPFLCRGGPMPVRLFSGSREQLTAQEAPAEAVAPRGGASEGGKPVLLVAACALVDADNRVLLARRPEGKPLAGLWEFPGGKVAPGETPEAALIRELKEELAIDVTAACLAPFTFASHAYEKFHLLMPLYLCRRWKGQVTAQEGQALAWVRPARLGDYAVPPADVPLVAMLRDFL
jgi:8-oxo-dGTP diphosphatase